VTKRSGTSTTPNAKRTRPMVTLTLSPEALARLDAIAAERGQSRSGAVEALVRAAADDGRTVMRASKIGGRS
jgi:metal-responsive CopG/Arc/MetJ family transcriptional regulator